MFFVFMPFVKNEMESKMEILHTLFKKWIFCFSSYHNRELKAKLSWSLQKKWEYNFCTIYFVQRKFFWHTSFISMYSVLNELSDYIYFYIPKSMLLHTILLFVFKIVKSRKCILKGLIKQEVYIKRHDKISKTS